MRNPVRKTDRGTTSHQTVLTAARAVIDDSAPIRATAKMHAVHYSTLCRYVKRVKSAPEAELPIPTIRATSPIGEFLPMSRKRLLLPIHDHCKRPPLYGMSTKEARVLVYQCAVKFGVNHPGQWDKAQRAREDLLSGFLARNPQLSIRTSEATSLARATGFNKTNVKAFFDKLSVVMERHTFEPNDIYNVDETGVTTVQKPSKIIPRKGAKQIGALTSGERGSLVTVELAVSASGNSIPPMFVFRRVKFHDHFIRDGPVGSIGVAHPSGWMAENSFVVFIKHFIHHAKPSQDRPVLLLLDNHNSHFVC